MEKYKFRSTVYLVFLLVSLVINGILLYMLMFENPKCEVKEEPETVDVSALVDDATLVYRKAYDLINGESGNFYIASEYKSEVNPSAQCYIVNFNGFGEFFTTRLIDELKNNLEVSEGIYYDCNNRVQEKIFVSLFGITDQGIRDLKYVMSNEDTLIVTGKLEYNSFIPGDKYPLYMIFKKVNGKYLIDSFE